MPAHVPSVRVRSDSDVDMIDSRISQPGMVEAHKRRASLSTNLLIAGVVFAVLMLVAREISIAFHVPWLDPRALLEKLTSLRTRP
jgi:hypothetical protein